MSFRPHQKIVFILALATSPTISLAGKTPPKPVAKHIRCTGAGVQIDLVKTKLCPEGMREVVLSAASPEKIQIFDGKVSRLGCQNAQSLQTIIQPVGGDLLDEAVRRQGKLNCEQVRRRSPQDVHLPLPETVPLNCCHASA